MCHKSRKQEVSLSCAKPTGNIKALLGGEKPAASIDAAAASSVAEPQPAPEPKKATVCAGLGWDITDDGQPWQELCKTYLHFIDGAAKASSTFTVDKAEGRFTARAKDCTGIGKAGWQHKVQCCKPCHAVRTDKNHVAKNSLLLMDKLLHSVSLLGQESLSKSDMDYLQHAVLERPGSSGNEALAHLKEAVKAKIAVESSAKKLPDALKGTSGEKMLNLVLEICEQGKSHELEGSVVFHMMLQFLAKCAGNPKPQVSSKVFAFARVLKHLHKPSYEFFRLNTLVGPHVDNIRKFEAKIAKDTNEFIIARSPEGVFY